MLEVSKRIIEKFVEDNSGYVMWYVLRVGVGENELATLAGKLAKMLLKVEDEDALDIATALFLDCLNNKLKQGEIINE